MCASIFTRWKNDNPFPNAVINHNLLSKKNPSVCVVLQLLEQLKRGQESKAESSFRKLKGSTADALQGAVYAKTQNLFTRMTSCLYRKEAMQHAWKQADNATKIACIEQWLEGCVKDKLRREAADALSQGHSQWGHSRFKSASSSMPVEHHPSPVLKAIKLFFQIIIFPWGLYSLYHRDSSLKPVGVAHLQGRRSNMEDEHLVATATSPLSEENSGTMQFFGIFDGHGGRSASQFAKAHFVSYFKSALKKHKNADNQEAAIFAALKQACIDLDKAYTGKAGSTMSVAIVIGSDLWVCNVGDARTVLVDNKGKARQLSEDQKCDSRKYAKGVESRGGRITYRPGDVPRVNGALAVPRALGDRDHDPSIVHTPKITRIPLKECAGAKLVIACDGLWDVASSQQIASYVHQEKNKTDQEIAEGLVGKAYHAGSTDNISALVVSLN